MNAYIGNVELPDDRILSIVRVGGRSAVTLSHDAVTASVMLSSAEVEEIAESLDSGLEADARVTHPDSMNRLTMLTWREECDCGCPEGWSYFANLSITGQDGSRVSADFAQQRSQVADLFAGRGLTEAVSA